MNEMNDMLHTAWVRWVLIAIGGLVIFFLAFSLGVSVGYEKGIFASRWGGNYKHNFLGSGFGMMGGGPGAPGGDAHGAAGTVISVGSTTIAIRDTENNEQSIAVASDTIIKKENTEIDIGDIAPGDHIVAIGSPDATGQVFARFIRVFSGPMPGMP
jgi:hypothetical protein